MNNHQYYLMIQQFTLFSDFFMHAVFSHSRKAVQLLARIVTGKKDLIVVEWGLEVKKGFPFFRNDRYDLFIIDQYGNVYNIEIENTLQSIGKRAFHNLSVLVAQGLKPGQKHKKLQENWVVFLTRKDFLKQNKPFYNYQWREDRSRQKLKTGGHIRIVNGQYQGKDALGKLMHDFHCTNPDDMFYDELREAVSYFKKEPEGVNTMCEIMREFERKSENKGRRQGRAEGRVEGRVEGRAEGRAQERQKAKKRMETIMCNLYAKGMDCPTIAEVTGQTVSKVETFFKKQALNKG
ncbi:hypothetical protein [uncultured Dubosiella sp.]|uniref:hypothetical protein n=1 Tax=uncultured Dubosiella sp. TaxID=1937011 RepID=UPI00266F0BF5|nr:hypothetical protein [uncultured Dubosiella sp.]